MNGWLFMTAMAALAMVPRIAAADEVEVYEEALGVGQRGFLGVELVELTPALRQHFGAPKEAGVMVGAVEDGSPAAKAGLKLADIVTAVDGHPVDDAGDLRAEVRRHKKGERVSLELFRDSKKQRLEVEVAEREVEEIDLGSVLRKLPKGSIRLRGDYKRAIERAMERMKEVQGNLPKIEEELEKKMKGLDQKLEKMEKRLREMDSGKGSHGDGV
jgi:hypothetical protein